MDATGPAHPPATTPEAILAALRRLAEPTPEAEDDALDRLVRGYEPAALRRALRPRLGALDDGDGGVVLRLLEAFLDPGLAADLARALVGQPDLAADRAWEALAVLDGAGRLADFPELVERWDELNDAIDPGDAALGLAEQLEEEPAGSWVALEGLGAIDPATRTEIIASQADAPAGPGLVSFLRLLAFAHDDATRLAALDVLLGPARDDDDHRRAWAEVAADHFDPKVRDRARRRLAVDRPDVDVEDYIRATTAPAARPDPELVGSLVTAVDGAGRGSVVLAGRDRGAWVVAAFACDVERGLTGIRGQVGDAPSIVASFFDDFAATAAGERIEDDPDVAIALLGESWRLSGPGTNPALRYWIERTVGPRFTPPPFFGPFNADDVISESLTLLAGASWAILEACPTWVDRSRATFDQAEAIILRAGGLPPDPRRDAGAFRYLFEHHLIGRLVHYSRLLLWMASFWNAQGDDDLARSALALAWQLADPQNAVPNHPFIIALATKSLAAAQADLRRGVDPRRVDRPRP